LPVPLKTIQERIGHALTGSFTLDVYGGKPEWNRNHEAARLVGAEIEKVVQQVGARRDEQYKPEMSFGTEEVKPIILAANSYSLLQKQKRPRSRYLLSR
jgi:hypothetical protein